MDLVLPNHLGVRLGGNKIFDLVTGTRRESAGFAVTISPRSNRAPRCRSIGSARGCNPILCHDRVVERIADRPSPEYSMMEKRSVPAERLSETVTVFAPPAMFLGVVDGVRFAVQSHVEKDSLSICV